MANPLDLEEQEQLDQLKHFWKQYGNLISTVLIVVFGGIAAWNGYGYWQRSQSAQASALYDEVDRFVGAGDAAKAERALQDLRERFGKTIQAQQAALLVARSAQTQQQPKLAREALTWLAEHGEDKGYAATARLRLAALLADGQELDEALKVLSVAVPPEFEALVADRRADILLLQGKREAARDEYRKAMAGLDSQSPYRTLVEVKLASVGGAAAEAAK